MAKFDFQQYFGEIAPLADAAVEILRYLGADFTAVGGPANCCGIIHEINGAGEGGRGAARPWPPSPWAGPRS